ncbi:LIM and cysteine-rich domains protein 1 isoform X2 [Takifugu rubripes]|uniref:LIM and cysteine-rich domains protein 1 isoform X2 n=1 Tax=Takifugu rubripes TaxID=31033 RepID=UPI0011456F3F|nr:LIM and cysteine-rich domains protein 1 isoform X2 [Takifugu rubripes]
MGRSAPSGLNVHAAPEEMCGQQRTGGASGCLGCNGCCSGFQPHPWSKACVTCGCSGVDHVPGGDAEDDQHMGRLLAGSPCSHLTTKVKGGGGLRTYKRNRMIVTNPVVSRKDPTFNTTTYDWAPAGLNQTLAMQFMQLIPEGQRPVAGTAGALQRRRKLLTQLPVYDQDPMKCQSLASEEEISSLLLFVKRYKEEVLGVGEVALPGEGGALSEAAAQRQLKDGADHGSPPSTGGSANGTHQSTKTEYRCSGCQGDVPKESLAVYAERAGYHGALWHPGCFACSVCGQGLVDLVYFWANQKLFCGRHYCESVWPRCCGCDELIVGQAFHTGGDGRRWHHQHGCCWRCGQSLERPCQHQTEPSALTPAF